MAKRGDWNVALTYRWLGSDAVLDAYTNSDFGLGGTNNKGYILGGSYAFDKNSWVSVRWMASDLIDSMLPKVAGSAAAAQGISTEGRRNLSRVIGGTFVAQLRRRGQGIVHGEVRPAHPAVGVVLENRFRHAQFEAASLLALGPQPQGEVAQPDDHGEDFGRWQFPLALRGRLLRGRSHAT